MPRRMPETDPPFAVKDSGERMEFDSGMVRDTTEGKVRYDLVYDGPMLVRWATHLTLGAEKYDARNWMLASGEAEYERFKESAARHFAQWYYGHRDEDHAAATVFNINGAEYVLDQMLMEAVRVG
jgi:hypothetical protein